MCARRRIYVRSPAAGNGHGLGEEVLERRLRLRVNQQKSAPGLRRGRLAPVGERKFLGYRLDADGTLGIAPKSLARAKSLPQRQAGDRLRQITKRNRTVGLEQMVGEANSFLAGWVTYFRHAHARSDLRGLDGWLRRKLRCVRLKQCKPPQGLRRFLKQFGLPPRQARELASSGRG